MTLDELQAIKRWHMTHRADRPLEYHLWDAMLMLWVLGWVGMLPAVAFEAFWALPLCLLGTLAPGLYVSWRVRAHRVGRLRCDWLAACPH